MRLPNRDIFLFFLPNKGKIWRYCRFFHLVINRLSQYVATNNFIKWYTVLLSAVCYSVAFILVHSWCSVFFRAALFTTWTRCIKNIASNVWLFCMFSFSLRTTCGLFNCHACCYFHCVQRVDYLISTHVVIFIAYNVWII